MRWIELLEWIKENKGCTFFLVVLFGCAELLVGLLLCAFIRPKPRQAVCVDGQLYIKSWKSSPDTSVLRSEDYTVDGASTDVFVHPNREIKCVSYKDELNE